MTLKEKLAIEFAKGMGDRVYDYHAKICFLAGFEKARELAGKLLAESYTNPRYVGQKIDMAVTMIADDVVGLGEEEV